MDSIKVATRADIGRTRFIHARIVDSVGEATNSDGHHLRLLFTHFYRRKISELHSSFCPCRIDPDDST